MSSFLKSSYSPHSFAHRPSQTASESFTIHEDIDCILDPQRGIDSYFHRLHGFRRQELAAFHISGVHKALTSYDLSNGHWCLNNPLPRRMNQARSYTWDNSEKGENSVPRDASEQGWTVGLWVSRLEEYERDGVFDWVRYRADGMVGDSTDSMHQNEEDADDEMDEEDDSEEEDSETERISDEEGLTISARIASLLSAFEELRLSYFPSWNINRQH